MMQEEIVTCVKKYLSKERIKRNVFAKGKRKTVRDDKVKNKQANRRFRNLDDMEQYLQYIGGGAGALALTGVAAASAFYLVSRPSAQKPLFPLDEQCVISPLSHMTINNGVATVQIRHVKCHELVSHYLLKRGANNLQVRFDWQETCTYLELLTIVNGFEILQNPLSL